MYRIITSLDFPALNSNASKLRRMPHFRCFATFHTTQFSVHWSKNCPEQRIMLHFLRSGQTWCIVYTLCILCISVWCIFIVIIDHTLHKSCVYTYSGYSVYYVCICKLYYTLSPYYTLLYNCARGELCAACLFSPSALIWPVMKRCTRSHFDI